MSLDNWNNYDRPLTLVKHKESDDVCMVTRIMQCGKNEGQLELFVPKHLQIYDEWNYKARCEPGSHFRAERDEVEEIKFKDDKSRAKFCDDSFGDLK